MDSCTGRLDVTEILLKTEINTIQSINQLTKRWFKYGCVTSVSQQTKAVKINPLPQNPSFRNPWKEVCQKLCGKKRKCWKQEISTFPTRFSVLFTRKSNPLYEP